MSDHGGDHPCAAALPPGCEAYRSTAEFTEATIPPGLLGRHRTATGTWALIHVLEGRLLYRVLEPLSERVLDPSHPPGLVEPGVPHQVALLGKLRFRVEFYRMKEVVGRPLSADAGQVSGEVAATPLVALDGTVEPGKVTPHGK